MRFFSFRESNRFLNIDRLSSCGMSGYTPTRSIEHRIVPSGNFGRQHNYLKESLVPSIKKILLDRRYDEPLSIYSRLVEITI